MDFLYEKGVKATVAGLGNFSRPSSDLGKSVLGSIRNMGTSQPSLRKRRHNLFFFII